VRAAHSPALRRPLVRDAGDQPSYLRRYCATSVWRTAMRRSEADSSSVPGKAASTAIGDGLVHRRALVCVPAPVTAEQCGPSSRS
jgi:hypothetical protein